MQLTQDMVNAQAEDVFFSAINKYAHRYKCERQDVQLVLGLDINGNVTYKLLKDYQPKEYVKLKDVTGLAMYMLAMQVVPKQVTGALQRLAVECETEPSNMSIMIMCDEEDVLHYLVYKDTDFLRETNLSETIKMDNSDE
jgi:hypothetical protein